MSEVSPFFGIFHDLAAAGGIIVSYGNLFPDILLGDSECLLDTQLHGKAVRIPSGFAFYMKALHCLVSAESILDGAGHHVMDAGHAVGRRGALIEDKSRAPLPLLHRGLEEGVGVPELEHLLVDVGEVELLAVFLEFLAHYDGVFTLNFKICPWPPLCPSLRLLKRKCSGRR